MLTPLLLFLSAPSAKGTYKAKNASYAFYLSFSSSASFFFSSRAFFRFSFSRLNFAYISFIVGIGYGTSYPRSGGFGIPL
jgi:hypothetical protein